MNNKKLFLYILIVLLFASCRAGMIFEGEGRIHLSLEANSKAFTYPDLDNGHNFADWPLGSGKVPKFSNITVSVSGPGMATETKTFSTENNTISINIPAGKNRRLFVSAEPDWDLTKAFYNDTKNLTTLALSYSGSTVIPAVVSGKEMEVSLKLSLESSKILLPELLDGVALYAFNSKDNTKNDLDYSPPLSFNSHFLYDKYGSLFVSSENKIYLARNESEIPSFVQLEYGSDTVLGMAFDQKKEWLYFIKANSDGNKSIGLFDFSDKSAGTYTPYEISAQGNFNLELKSDSLAVDDEGYLYFYISEDNDTLYGLARAKVEKSQGSYILSSYDFYSAESLKLGYEYENYPDSPDYLAAYQFPFNQRPRLEIGDMTYKDGKLYILLIQQASDSSQKFYLADLYSRGKLVVINLPAVSFKKELGWSYEPYQESPSSTALLYGPKRFAGIGKDKLYFIDEGFYYNSSENALKNVDRIMEVNTNELSGFNIVQGAGSNFFSDFSNISIDLDV